MHDRPGGYGDGEQRGSDGGGAGAGCVRRGETDSRRPQAAVGTPTGASARGAVKERPRGVVEDCSTRSEAGVPGGDFSDPRNLVVGPLVLVGDRYTPASTVREFGGNNFAALVTAGHRVTVVLSRRTRRVAALGYGPHSQRALSELSPRDGYRVVTFIACRAAERAGSTADGQQPVTAWSGFVLTRSPRCVPLEVWVDDEPSPRHTALGMGVRRCP
jgi:hypothetical protein